MNAMKHVASDGQPLLLFDSRVYLIQICREPDKETFTASISAAGVGTVHCRGAASASAAYHALREYVKAAWDIPTEEQPYV
jgi:hypothetical protein